MPDWPGFSCIRYAAAWILETAEYGVYRVELRKLNPRVFGLRALSGWKGVRLLRRIFVAALSARPLKKHFGRSRNFGY